MRKLASLLYKESGSLQRSLEHSRRLKQLDYGIRSLLPADLANHCQTANLRNNSVIMQADSTVWATRLRYQVPELLKQLRCHDALKGLKTIRVTVAPLSGPQPPKRKPLAISNENGDVLRSAADSLSDPELAAALRRLARHARR